jgi:hypothetical protein
MPEPSAWSLPLGDDGDQYLQVSRNEVTNRIVVQWMRRDVVIDELSREIAATSIDLNTASEK